MASGYFIQDKNNCLPCLITVTATPATLASLVATALGSVDKIPSAITGIELSNMDAAATVYISYSSDMSTTKYKNAILPATHYEDNIRRAPFNQMYIRSSTGSVLVYVVIFNS